LPPIMVARKVMVSSSVIGQKCRGNALPKDRVI
jgi:hypothetical protein